MIINTFNGAWFLSFAAAIILILIVSFLCKGKSDKFKKNVMAIYYIFLWLFYVAYKGYLINVDTYETCWWNELPFALCQVASMMALPGILLNNGALMGFCFYVSPVCTLLAILMPVAGFYDIPLLSLRSVGFYGFHWLAFAQGVLLYTTGIYKPKVRDSGNAAILLAIFALIAHGINYYIRLHFYPEANYFFTYDPQGNPVLLLLRKYINVNFFYLLPCIVPAWLFFFAESLIFKERNHEIK